VSAKSIESLGIAGQFNHPVWLTRIDDKYFAVIASPTDKVPDRLESALAALALWQTGSAQGNPGEQLRLEWLLVGLCFGTLADYFEEPVQEYVLGLVRHKAQELDQWLDLRGARFKPYEERWREVISIKPK
jgi:hypothetical protein